MTKVAASGKAELEAAKVAAEKSSNPQVKQFAQKMVQDHMAANDELSKLASAKGVTLPPAQADHGDHAGAIKRIAEAKGADVDRQFLRGFGADEHDKDIMVFERAARESNDADVRAFAEKTLPKLREHQQLAQQLQQGGGAKGTKTGTQTSMN
jgi:putative membrane protein